MKILVAEDDDLSFAVLNALLRHHGRQLVLDRAVNGAQVCTKFEQSGSEYSLLIMDIELPDMSGFEATRRVRAFEKAYHLKPLLVVALTGHEGYEVTQQAFQAQIDIVLRKPVKVAELDVVLRQAEKYCSISDRPTASNAPATQSAPHGGGPENDLQAAVRGVRHQLWLDVLRAVSEIPIALEIRCSESLRHIANNIKAAGAHLSVPGIVERARAIQHAAADMRWTAVQQIAADMLDLLAESDVPSDTSSGPPTTLNTSASGGGSAPSPSPPASGCGSPVPFAAAYGLQPPPHIVGVSPDGMRGVVMPSALRLAAADSVVTSLRERGLAELRAHIDRVNIDLFQGDFASIARVGHVLKGVGGNLGHPVVSELGLQLREAALSCSTEQVRRVIIELMEYERTAENDVAEGSLHAALNALMCSSGGRDGDVQSEQSPKRVRPCAGGQEDDEAAAAFQESAGVCTARMFVALDWADYTSAEQSAIELQSVAEQAHRSDVAQLAARSVLAAQKKQLQSLHSLLHDIQCALENS